MDVEIIEQDLLADEKLKQIPGDRANSAPVHVKIGPMNRSTRGCWTVEEDIALARAVKSYEGKTWKKIAEHCPGKSDVQCLHRWQKVIDPSLTKGTWRKEEDESLLKQIEKHGAQHWSVIAAALPGRSGKQCRERWHNHLNPAIRKDPWTKEEEAILIREHASLGNKWAKIATKLPGRTDNAIKNHWHCHLKRKMDSPSLSGCVAPPSGASYVDSSNHVLQNGHLKADHLNEAENNLIAHDQKLNVVRPDVFSSVGLAHRSKRPREWYPNFQPVAMAGLQCSILKDQHIGIKSYDCLAKRDSEQVSVTRTQVYDHAISYVGDTSIQSSSCRNVADSISDGSLDNPSSRSHNADRDKLDASCEPVSHGYIVSKRPLQIYPINSFNSIRPASPPRRYDDYASSKNSSNEVLQSCNSNGIEKVGDQSQTPTAPVQCENDKVSRSVCTPLKSMEAQSEQRSGQIDTSTPADASPELLTVLANLHRYIRRAAENYKDFPSILRKPSLREL